MTRAPSDAGKVERCEVSGPYHYQADLRPCFVIRDGDGLPRASVYVFDGDEETAHRIATKVATAIDAALRDAPHDVVSRIAQVAKAVGIQAGVGASETAGRIISVLYANPHLTDRFMAEGTELFIEGLMVAENGALTFHARSGEVLTPTELVRRTGRGPIQ